MRGLLNLKIKNVLSFETSVIISQSRWRNIPEGLYLQILCTTRTYKKDFQVRTWIIFVRITRLIDKKNPGIGIHHEEPIVARLDIMESGGSLELLSMFLSRIFLQCI
jgi:hypothetical protein